MQPPTFCKDPFLHDKQSCYCSHFTDEAGVSQTSFRILSVISVMGSQLVGLLEASSSNRSTSPSFIFIGSFLHENHKALTFFKSRKPACLRGQNSNNPSPSLFSSIIIISNQFSIQGLCKALEGI